MNNVITVTIKKQLENCRELLIIFKNEREMYQQKKSVSLNDVMLILKRKQEIMSAFDEQQNILKKIKEKKNCFSEEEKLSNKKLLRELASTLEQLLVIDQENEKLLRELVSTNRNTKSQDYEVEQHNKRIRVGLKPNLPFVPENSCIVRNNPGLKQNNPCESGDNMNIRTSHNKILKTRERNVTNPITSARNAGPSFSHKQATDTEKVIYERKNRPVPGRHKLKNYLLAGTLAN